MAYLLVTALVRDGIKLRHILEVKHGLLTGQAILALDDNVPEYLLQVGDLASVQGGDRAVDVAQGHEEDALARDEAGMVETRAAEGQGVAELGPVQPAGVGFEEGA